MLLKIKSFLSLIGLNIGIAWIKLFDKRQLLFKNLKPLKWFRYFIYTITIVVFYLLLEVLQTYFLNVLNDYNFQPIIYTTIIAFALIFKIIAMFGMFGIVFLEYVYDFDLDTYMTKIKKEQEYIKTNKLDAWRLRNLKWWARICIYLGIYIFFIHIFFNAYITSIYPINKDTLELALKEWNIIAKQFTILFLLFIALFDFLKVRPARKKVLQIPKFKIDD
ncbi:hypothetical protein [Aliarcobacter butzleri]|uniref:Uncharacterized protein n=1 Tax=Aliarcobacter butzleri L352 TaxID=1447260 RepID=A0A837JDR4_9BACT|nr:hypothetical protein [Aliarcobacter butzleri]KLE06057.1 hypothetical protein AF77_03065 [Aliarcobacter butzleri L352]